jgi:Aminopeptidase I zinc metalloprotease (M18)
MMHQVLATQLLAVREPPISAECIAATVPAFSNGKRQMCARVHLSAGPILASGLGCRTVDVGQAMLSMHSIREMCGTQDVAHSYNHFVAFFKDFSRLDATLDVDGLPPPAVLGSIVDTPCEVLHEHGHS